MHRSQGEGTTAPFSPGHLVTQLALNGSILGQRLLEVGHWPLHQYLKSLMSVRRANKSTSFSLCIEALARRLTSAGSADTETETWCESLRSCPVIQQADHSNLLLDQETLLNNILFSLAAHLAGVRKVITVQCSSISCITRRNPYNGPAFLHTRKGEYNVFGLTRRMYARAAFSQLPAPISTVFVPSTGSDSLHNDPLLGSLHGRTWSNALESFRIVNAHLWTSMGGAGFADVLFLDDRFSVELLAGHFEVKTSPLHTLVFDSNVRRAFATLRQEHLRRTKGVSLVEPDFFWIKRGSRFEPARVDTAVGSEILIGANLDSVAHVSVDGKSLAALLREGMIIPNKTLIYFARCLLPGIRALGGTSQQDYLSHYQTLLLALHEETKLLDAAEVENVRRTDLNQLSGAPLIEPDAELAHELAFAGRDVNWRALLNRHLSNSLSITVGDLRCADYLRKQFNGERNN